MINFNGKIIPADQTIFGADNRAFLYGDALFETMRMTEGKIPFLELHLNRLLHGLGFLKYKIPKKYTTSFFQKEINKIALGNKRIRLTVFRSAGGLYTPKNNRPQFLITTSPLATPKFELNKKGLQIGVFEDVKLSCTPLSNLKTCNSLPYILAGIYKREQNLEDCILLNEKGKVAEASSSNIFLFKKNTLITPSLSEGCIDGTLRKVILQMAKKDNLKIREIPVSLSSLEKAEEIWLTNAIQGIRWVSQFGASPPLPFPTYAPKIITKLNSF